MKFDVAVIGAGAAGLAAASELSGAIDTGRRTAREVLRMFARR